jgi:hypothetical protein
MEISVNYTGKSDILGQNPSHCHMNYVGIELGVSFMRDSQLPPDIPVEWKELQLRLRPKSFLFADKSDVEFENLLHV